jgi:hypothetical protein
MFQTNVNLDTLDGFAQVYDSDECNPAWRNG